MSNIIEYGYKVTHGKITRLFNLSEAAYAQVYAEKHGVNREEFSVEYLDPSEDTLPGYQRDLVFGEELLRRSLLFFGAKNRLLNKSKNGVDALLLLSLTGPIRARLAVGDLTKALFEVESLIVSGDMNSFSVELGNVLIELENRIEV